MMKRFVAVLATALLVGLPGVAQAHATLLKAEPAKGSTLASCPSRVMLLFSEPLEPAMAHIVVAGKTLATTGDPHDVHAVIAPLDCLGAGTYTVTWHVVSADGHSVNGTYSFAVQAGAPAVVAPAPVAESAMTSPQLAPDVSVLDSISTGPSDGEFPTLAAVLRGAALVSLMAFSGLVFFRDKRKAVQFGQMETILGFLAPALLAAHLAAWTANADAAHHMNVTALSTTPGRLELWRLGLSVLALWALILARRPTLAMLLGFGALGVSGAIGHAAAIHPEGTIAGKALHLIAGAVWLGGLLHLITLDRNNAALFVRQASRVSNIAFVAVIVVTLSGVIQWRYFLPTFRLLDSSYGMLLAAKLALMALLLGFGAYHRYKVIPRLTQAGNFRASLRAEVTVMIVVAMLGAMLAYTSIPVIR